MVNLCSSDHLSSVCTQENWEAQRGCDFSEKSRFRDACIHFFSGSKRCDNFKAHKKKREENDEKN